MLHTDIRFFESAANVRSALERSLGVKPKVKLANEVAVCVQQGRLFFEAASESPLQIKPLLVYYGVVAFATAVTLARNQQYLESLKPSHGLADTTKLNARIEDLELQIQQEGLFSAFDRTIASLGGICLYIESMPKWLPHPFNNASSLAGQKVGFRKIFSRIPWLEKLYAKTFEEHARTNLISLFRRAKGDVELRIDDSVKYSDINSLVHIIDRWRNKYSLLSRWSFTNAQLAYDNSVITFLNYDNLGIDEFGNDLCEWGIGAISAPPQRALALKMFDIREGLPPIAGGITQDHTHLICNFNGVYLAEHSWQFLGCFLLSSLVRYRPQIWQNAVSRSYSSHSPPDDRCLALIDEFLSSVLRGFPTLVVRAIEHKS